MTVKMNYKKKDFSECRKNTQQRWETVDVDAKHMVDNIKTLLESKTKDFHIWVTLA